MQIVYTDKKLAESDLIELEELAKPLHQNGTENYSSVVEHPSEKEYAIRVTLMGDYKEVVEKWIKSKGLKLEEVTIDWKNQDIL